MLWQHALVINDILEESAQEGPQLAIRTRILCTFGQCHLIFVIIVALTTPYRHNSRCGDNPTMSWWPLTKLRLCADPGRAEVYLVVRHPNVPHPRLAGRLVPARVVEVVLCPVGGEVDVSRLIILRY